jgi:branched-chain amino acid transport system permease protein
MVLLPEAVQGWRRALGRGDRPGAEDRQLDQLPARDGAGAAIILFLIFEPDGLARRWRLIKAYWKLYPYSH